MSRWHFVAFLLGLVVGLFVLDKLPARELPPAAPPAPVSAPWGVRL